jgi:hypothetical protein
MRAAEGDDVLCLRIEYRPVPNASPVPECAADGTGAALLSGGGLGPLPAWIRRLERTRRWVGCKIVLYHARLQWRIRDAA